MSDVQFVLLGPVETNVSALRSLPNVHLLGTRPHVEIPSYLKGLKVGLIPYQVTEYTSHVYPTKLNEYLAMGLPVVGTPLPELRRFNRIHPEIVQLAEDADAFCQVVRRALQDNAPKTVARRIDVARANRWEARIPAITSLIEGALAARRTQRESAAGGGPFAASALPGNGGPVIDVRVVVEHEEERSHGHAGG